MKTDRDQILFSLNLNANKRAWHGYLLTRAVQNLPAGNNALPPATDRLATTFAMEGAIACERSGAEVPRSYWDANRNTLLLEQSRNMGFARYGAPTQADPESVLATAAGALAVDIADFFVGSSGYKCNGSMQPSPAARAWDRLGTAAQVFVPVQLEPGTPPLFDNVMPMLVAETARMLGRKDLGGVPVYLMVAGQLLKTQNPDGSWGAAGQPQAVSVVETALAIITLAEVRAPVAMNKVVPRPADNRDWNERPRDVANFIDWFERDSTTSTPNVPRASWQAVALVNLNDLQTSNVLNIGGAEPFNLAPAEVQLLTQFVANGGTIVGSADCGKKGFAKSFALAAGAILPGQAGKELPPNHPLFAAQNFKAAKWKVQLKVIGWTMQNREAILLIPESDAGKWWAMQAATTKRELFELGANIVQYAGGPKAR